MKIEQLVIPCKSQEEDYLRIADTGTDTYAVITVCDNFGSSDILVDKESAQEIINNLKSRFGI